MCVCRGTIPSEKWSEPCAADALQCVTVAPPVHWLWIKDKYREREERMQNKSHVDLFMITFRMKNGIIRIYIHIPIFSGYSILVRSKLKCRHSVFDLGEATACSDARQRQIKLAAGNCVGCECSLFTSKTQHFIFAFILRSTQNAIVRMSFEGECAAREAFCSFVTCPSGGNLVCEWHTRPTISLNDRCERIEWIRTFDVRCSHCLVWRLPHMWWKWRRRNG